MNFSEGSRKRIFSGLQPTGEPHLGNYIGAIRRWVAMQDEFESFFCIVDLHAMTMPWDPKALNDQSRLTGAVLVACGIDPDKAVLFRQSQVAQHTELAWMLTCLARMGELRRMVQFKEKSKGETESVGAGILTYPALQAADVLLYQAHGVPVGEDQRQHIELMRDLAERFNKMLGRSFVIPEPWIAEEGAKILALDDPRDKMSKSSTRPNSAISVSDPPEMVEKKIRSAVTDSGREVTVGEDKPALTNLLTIYSILEGTPIEVLVERFAGGGYAPFKQALAECVVEHLRPLRERYLELMGDPAELDRLLAHGAKRAADVAEETMVEVRRRAGLGPRP